MASGQAALEAALSGVVTDYAGDVAPDETWQMLAENGAATLVDVRTPPEWVFEGIPNLSSIQKKPVQISWQTYPNFEINADFPEQLRSVVPHLDTPLYFICRVGGRSRQAAIAATAMGYRQCYNVSDGFMGPLDQERRRGAEAGWKASGLPWEQG